MRGSYPLHQQPATAICHNLLLTVRLSQFFLQTPHDSERVATFAGADESALFHRLDGIAIGRQRAYFFIVFQPPQNGVAAERISFKLVALLACATAGLVQSLVSFGGRLAAFFFAII
jgi:hypothetical protein